MNGLQWAVLAALGVGASILVGSPIPLGFGVAIAIALAFGLLTSRPVERKATVEREVDRTLISAGDSVTVRVRAHTPGNFGLRWLVVRDTVPANAFSDAPTGKMSFGRTALESGFFYRSLFPARGLYEIGPLEIRSGDILGLRDSSWFDPQVAKVWVHPRVYNMRGFRLRSNRSFGENRPDRRAAEDPTRPAGSRAYMAGDPLKRVHWAATARTGELVSKVYDGSSAPVYVVLIDRNQDDYADPEAFELACTATASIVHGLIHEGHEVSLIANEDLAAGKGRIHEEKCLTKLAEVRTHKEWLAKELISARHRLEWRATLIVVTGKLDEKSAGALELLRKSGHAIAVMLVGPEKNTAPSVAPAAAIGAAVAKVTVEEEIETARFIDANGA